MIANAEYISEWKSKGLFHQIIKPAVTSDNSLFPLTDYLDNKIRLKFNKLTYPHRKIVNIYILYEITVSGSLNDDPK